MALKSGYVSLQGEFWKGGRNGQTDTDGDGLVVPNVGLEFMGNAKTAGIRLRRETRKHRETFTGRRTIDNKKTIERGAELNLELEDLTAIHNLRMLFQGRNNVVDSGSATNVKLIEPIAIAPFYKAVAGSALPTLGKTYLFGRRQTDGTWLPYRNIATSGLTITDSTGTPKTLTAGTNYTVTNWRRGELVFTDLTTGGAFAGPLKGAFSYGTVTDTLGDSINFGMRYPLSHPNVSNLFIKDSAGTPVTVSTSYYTVYGPEGAIEFKNLAGFEAAAYVFPLKVTYTTLPSYHIAFLQNQAEPEFWVRFKGIDTENDDRLVMVDLYRVSFEMDGALPLLNEDLSSISVKGDCLTDLTKEPDGVMGQVGRYVHL